MGKRDSPNHEILLIFLYKTLPGGGPDELGSVLGEFDVGRDPLTTVILQGWSPEGGPGRT